MRINAKVHELYGCQQRPDTLPIINMDFDFTCVLGFDWLVSHECKVLFGNNSSHAIYGLVSRLNGIKVKFSDSYGIDMDMGHFDFTHYENGKVVPFDFDLWFAAFQQFLNDQQKTLTLTKH